MLHDIHIRIAPAGDEAVARLAALDSAAPIADAALVATAGGRAVAAVAYDGSAAVADPFLAGSGEVVALLTERSAQLRGQRVAGSLRAWRRGERVPRRRRAARPVLHRRVAAQGS